MKSVIVTGPESSGKTTLTQGLSLHFKSPYLPEYARYYLGTIEHYDYEDIITIAKTQSRLWWQYVLTERELVIIDTWYVVIHVWLEYRYGKVPPFISSALLNWQNECLFLLCKPDIAWMPDPLRENKNNRDELFDLYLNVMNKYNLNFKVIQGKNRIEQGIQLVNQYIGQ